MKNNLLSCFLLNFWAVLCYGPTPATANDEIAPAPQITYTLSMPEPATHYFEVEMTLINIAGATNLKKNGYLDLKMPVWTPGSYLIREYAKNVEAFRATVNGQPVATEKIRKNAWRISTGPATDDITVRYRVYAYELTVRTSFLDDSHGYVNGASMFLFNDALKTQPARLVIQPAKGWNKVSVALKPASGANGFVYEVPDYDLLVDSPIEIGNHRTFTFTAAGVPHTVAQYGEVEYNEQRLSADYKKVCETAASIFGEHPCAQYTFIVQHAGPGGGGLEHQNSTTLQTNRLAYSTEANYKGFLTLVAHEYFHLWNVKRLRPIALGPFDYENENYTKALWEAEGFTSFYEDYILRLAGFHTPEQYMAVVAADINGIENQPGNRVQSVADASFDAWIKYYRPNENSGNSTISYYNKGSVLASLLNLSIINSTNGEKNLSDAMRLLYTKYYKELKRGFRDDELKQALEQVGGKNLDDFFKKYVYGTDPIDYAPFFEPVGLRLANANANAPDAYLGVAVGLNPINGRQTITSVRRGSSAEGAGLNVGDEILAIDSVRVTDDVNKLVAATKAGSTFRMLVNRGGLLRELPVTLARLPLVAYRLEAIMNQTEKQKILYRKWMVTK
jgi:predicted metalloprotease with PDZ domain